MMKKNKITIFVALCLLLTFQITVLAYESPNYWGPNLTPGEPKPTTVDRVGSTSGNLTGAGCKTYFYDFMELSDDLAYDSDRKLTMKLYDDDLWNSDDHIKTYEGSFRGRLLIDVVLKETKNGGQIESDDDDAAELYLECELDEVDGDNGTSGNFFKYWFEVD